MSTPIGLGLPEAPLPTLAPRRKTRQIMVGNVGIGSDYPVSVQSMTTTKTLRCQRNPAANRTADRIWLRHYPRRVP